jgi:argininosuccinate synthase
MKVVLAYSGGLDSTVAIPWLVEQHHADVVTVTLDVGQGRELEHVRERALAAGAVRAHVLESREDFARRFITPALQAGALYERRYPLATALTRPLIASALVEIAALEGASAVAHACSGKGNDQVRLDVALRTLAPDLQVIGVARSWGMTRADAHGYAAARGLSVPTSLDTPYTVDANLWGRSIEYSVLQDGWQEPPADLYTLSREPDICAREAAAIEVDFERGIPVAVNGVTMPLVELIDAVGTIAGDHGIGRIDMIENRILGYKSREIYEAPAAVVLHAAHRELEALVLPRDLDRLKRDLADRYADLVYDGRWFTPTRDAIDAFVAVTQARVTGSIRLKLFGGDCRVVGRRSPWSLVDPALVAADRPDQFDAAGAAAFARVQGLPAETARRLENADGNAP